MKLHLDKAPNEYRITSYADDGIVINQVRYEGPVVVSVHDEPTRWAVSRIDELGTDAIAELVALEPEVMLIGTGPKQQFPDMAALALPYQKSIGVEVMDTRAACRTFNIVAAEGRRVVAALLPLDD